MESVRKVWRETSTKALTRVCGGETDQAALPRVYPPQAEGTVAGMLGMGEMVNMIPIAEIEAEIGYTFDDLERNLPQISVVDSHSLKLVTYFKYSTKMGCIIFGGADEVIVVIECAICSVYTSGGVSVLWVNRPPEQRHMTS